MTVTISGVSAPRLFRESLYKMRVYGSPEESRNGDVYTIEQPVVISLWNPLKRVITDPTRNANPFFHVMEFVWMMAGSNDITWIAHFNKQMMAYSDDGETVNGAYGYRWRKHFIMDQIDIAIEMLRKNKKDRRVVLAMWDPDCDMAAMTKDVPCNTHIYLRVVNNCLDMTVCNRSNDLIWGALGANIVHMTFLQELIANALGLPCGEYRVFTNNLHIYKSVPNFDYYVGGCYEERDIYNGEARKHVPLLQPGENHQDFLIDCQNFVRGKMVVPRTEWIKKIAEPVYQAWGSRTDEALEDIEDDAWRIACSEWVARKRLAVADKLTDNNPRLVSGQQESVRVDSGIVQSSPLVNLGPCEPDVGTITSQSCPDTDVHP